MLPAGLLQSMVALHDALFLLAGVDGEALQAAIAKVRARPPCSSNGCPQSTRTHIAG